MKETRCIICGEKKNGLPVNEDAVLHFLRLFKRHVTRNEKGYNLVVCKGCYVKYDTAKRKYERRQMIYLILGVIFALFIVVTGANKFVAVIFAIVIVGLLYLLSLLTYMPSVSMPSKGRHRK
jgi:hypothetical protein